METSVQPLTATCIYFFICCTSASEQQILLRLRLARPLSDISLFVSILIRKVAFPKSCRLVTRSHLTGSSACSLNLGTFRFFFLRLWAAYQTAGPEKSTSVGG